MVLWKPAKVLETPYHLGLFFGAILILEMKMLIIAHVVLMVQQYDDMVPLIPNKFDGNSSFDDWVGHFECVVALQ